MPSRARGERIARVRLAHARAAPPANRSAQRNAQSPSMWTSSDSFTGFSTGVASSLSRRDAAALGRRLASHSPLRPRSPASTSARESPSRRCCLKPSVKGALQGSDRTVRSREPCRHRRLHVLPAAPTHSISSPDDECDSDCESPLLGRSRESSPARSQAPRGGKMTCAAEAEEVMDHKQAALSTAYVVDWCC